ncbi:MAG: GxxExxY protein [Candidatus Doudnabacteria bacterium]|nr:GxxExxY protein [Candidatus Doudnabacteria bacterium]
MDTNIDSIPELLFPELSYQITGALFRAHNALGPYAREKQYGDLLEKELVLLSLNYIRECRLGGSGNIVDFVVEDKVVVELKAKRILQREDYEQVQRYLQESVIRLGLLVNFRNKYIKPVRIVRIDKLRR